MRGKGAGIVRRCVKGPWSGAWAFVVVFVVSPWHVSFEVCLRLLAPHH